MENKKLIKILAKDMTELEELIADMKIKQQFDALEMEFIHTRARGVVQLLQMLNAGDEPVVPVTVEENKILEKLKDKVEKVAQITSEMKPGADVEEKTQEETMQVQKEQSLPEVVPEPSDHDADDSSLNNNEEVQVSLTREDEDDEMLQEEIRKPDAGSRLGDSFLKGKSVNDLITDQVKLEFKLSNRPVGKIQTSIGINDRFQYIRELFDGDNRKFVETVKTLDSMENIKDAIEYLRTNYKWKKNETSLKFVNLVKRRFQNAATG